MGKWFLAVLFLSVSSQTVVADEQDGSLDMATPYVSTIQSDMNLPAKGIGMDRVLAEYGEPLTKHEAVGIPPITRWDYADFSVFFENQNVIHSVIHQPAQP